MKLTYAVVFERGPNNYSAYVPDLPGCVSTGRTWKEMQGMITEAIAGHIEVTREYGEPVPPPRTSVAEELEFHRAQPNDYGGYFPAPEDSQDKDDPYAILEIEVEAEVNLEAVPAP